MTPSLMMHVFIHTVEYKSPSPLFNLLSHYPMNVLKLLPFKSISSMVSLLPVDSYHASVITKYKSNMQVQKQYKIHDNNTANPSAKLTETLCVNPYIVQPHWKSCIRKQSTTLVSIIR